MCSASFIVIDQAQMSFSDSSLHLPNFKYIDMNNDVDTDFLILPIH